MKNFPLLLLMLCIVVCHACEEGQVIDNMVDDVITTEQPVPEVLPEREIDPEKEYVNFGGIIAERVRLEGEHLTIDRYVDIVDGVMLVEGRNHVAAFGLKEGEWLVTLNSEVSLGWIDPRPIPDIAIANNNQVFQWTAETIGVSVEILLKGPSDKLQEPTDEWLVSLLNENSTEIIKVSPDGRATVFRYVRRTNQ